MALAALRRKYFAMDVFQKLGTAEETVRTELENLDWSGPTAAADVSAQFRGLADDLLADVPARAVFHESDEVARAIGGEIDLNEDEFPAEGAEETPSWPLPRPRCSHCT